MKHIKLFSFLMVYIEIASKLIAQLPSSDPAYQLVFVVEFNGNFVDTSVWLQRPPLGIQQLLYGHQIK